MARIVRALVLLGLISATATAQTIWTVTAQNGIQAAINAASPGDVIVLTNVGGMPDYTPFTLNKGLTIRGNGARIGNTSATALSIQILLPPGEVAHIERIDTYSYAIPIIGVGCSLLVNGGSVRFEQCTLRSVIALRVSNADVVVTGGAVTGLGNNGSNPAIDASNSHLTLRDCTVTGSPPSWGPFGFPFFSPRPALAATNCVVHAERVQFLGGSNGTVLPANGANSVELFGSTAFFADCTLTGGASNSGTGGMALWNSSATAADLRNTQLVAGSPGGSVSSGPINPAAPLVRLGLVPPWLRGSTSVLTCDGDPNTLFAIALAPDVLPASIAYVVEPVWFVTGTAVLAGMLDPAGIASVQVAVPNVPSLEHLTVWCQAVSGNSLPLRASTLAGGVVR